jgi:hypothetical protein
MAANLDQKTGDGLSYDVTPTQHSSSDEPHYDVAILNTEYEGKPTPEELTTLRRVPGKLPTVAYLLCAVEFCERASYYGMISNQAVRNQTANMKSRLRPDLDELHQPSLAQGWKRLGCRSRW